MGIFNLSSKYIGILLCIVSIIIILFVVYFTKTTEGFSGYPVNEERINYEEQGKRKYNALGDLTGDPTKEGVIPSGPSGDKMVNNLLSTPDYEGDSKSVIIAQLNYNSPLPFRTSPEKTQLLQKIKFCESVKEFRCEKLSDPDFNRDCGLCYSDGVDHLGNPHIGGLYYDSQGKDQEIQSAKRESREAKFEPTVGTCKGKFVVDRPKCDIEKDRAECATYINFDTLGAREKCGQCTYNNTFLYMGNRNNAENNFALIKNDIKFRLNLKIVISDPEKASIIVRRVRDSKKIEGSYIPDTNIFMISFDAANENEEFTLNIRYPEYSSHTWTEEEKTRINAKANPKRASLISAKFGPFINDPENDDPRAADVTELIKTKYKITDCQRSEVTASVSALQKDPNPGIYKQLRLVFSDNGTDFAYAYAGESQKTKPVLDKGNYVELCPVGIPQADAEKHVCEINSDGDPIDSRVYTGGKNSGYYGSDMKAVCLERVPKTPRGIAGVWESTGKVKRTVPFNISVTKLNGFDITSNGPNILGTLKSSKLFKHIGPSKYRGVSEHLFWFWARDNGLANVQYNFVVPATLRDPTLDEDIKLCPTGPIITTPEGAVRMKSGVCEQPNNGSEQGPGNFSDQCIKALFTMSGCNELGKMFPNSLDKKEKITRDEKTGDNLDIDTIINKLADIHSIGTTGRDQDGKEYEDSSIETAAKDCFGVIMSNPCDGPFAETGPHTAKCLDYLFRNAGESNNKVGQTYAGMTNRSSGNKNNDKLPVMYCQRGGFMAPIGKDGKPNYDAITKANAKGGISAVKEFYRQIHFNANFNKEPAAQQKGMFECYGVNYKFETGKCPRTAKTQDPFKYMGCWGDAGDRAISNYSGQVTSAEQCYSIAKQRNATVFGLQYGGECFTGTNSASEWQRYGKRDDVGCTPLGGTWTNQVYVIQ